MIKRKMGFATMDKEKRVKIASMGGIAATKSGNAHRWTREEARAAGKLGGKAKRKKSL